MEISEDDETERLIEAGMRLLDLAQSGDLAAVQQYVKTEQPPMFFEDPDCGWSSLHVAASIEYPELISYLLEEGAVWNAGLWLFSLHRIPIVLRSSSR